MRYRTKITYLTGGKEYKPGTVLPSDISKADLAFLRSKGFVEPADTVSDAEDYDYAMEEDDIFSGFHEHEPDAFKSVEEILKIRAKKDVSSYAASIGLDLGEDYEGKSLKELQEEVINFQEERLAEDGEDDI